MVEPLPLVRDVLDKQIYDVNGERIAKVDGIALLPRTGRPPRVLAIESDFGCACRRVWRPLGDWVDRFQHWLKADIAGPTRIQFDHVVAAGIDVRVDVDGRKTNAFAWETWLSQFIASIPGGKGHGEKGQ